MLLTYFNRKEYLRHRAVSLRQHGFLVLVINNDEKGLKRLKTFLSRPRSRSRLLSQDQDQDQDLCFCPRGASRPRPWSRGLHHWILGTENQFIIISDMVCINIHKKTVKSYTAWVVDKVNYIEKQNLANAMARVSARQSLHVWRPENPTL